MRVERGFVTGTQHVKDGDNGCQQCEHRVGEEGLWYAQDR